MKKQNYKKMYEEAVDELEAMQFGKYAREDALRSARFDIMVLKCELEEEKTRKNLDIILLLISLSIFIILYIFK
jgi:hypothetical protein